ncbi:MAG TPA: hypothetical protein DEB40_01400 [Elusimicrobia bacterium]|nr:hypothetical protein [Elusimicrobiota bacterium]HBT60386.1 hypothetical protein [Elusimicrobiota bacterium]
MINARKAVLSIALLLICGVLAAAPFPAEPADSIRRIVVFRGSIPSSQQVAVAQASGGVVVRALPLINAVVIAVPKARAKAADLQLQSRPEVAWVDEDPKVNWLNASPQSLADIVWPDIHSVIKPFRGTGAARKLPWGIVRVNAPGAWSVTRGEGVKVCVIDTGIDYAHPDLEANIRGGWNAIERNDDFMDDNGHGSHVAGVIAAVDDGSGVVGVAPQASIYGVKVLDAAGGGNFDDVIAGMQWAVDNRMDVASMSLGTGRGNDSLKAAVEAMAKNGVVLVAAAGNAGPGENTVIFPGGYPGAVAIAASDSSDQIAYFSSRGDAVALAAPGVGIYSTFKNGGYKTLDGTSMATPHVSGLAALFISAKGVRGLDAVRAALIRAATPLKGVSGEPFSARWQGAGMADAAKLVR